MTIYHMCHIHPVLTFLSTISKYLIVPTDLQLKRPYSSSKQGATSPIHQQHILIIIIITNCTPSRSPPKANYLVVSPEMKRDYPSLASNHQQAKKQSRLCNRRFYSTKFGITLKGVLLYVAQEHRIPTSC